MHAMEARVAMGARGGSRTRTVTAAPALPGVLALATAAGVVPQRSAPRPRVARHAGKPRLRLTRRGRAVVFAFFLLLAAAGVTLAATASRAADPSGPPPTTVVRQGDTLWSIADRHHPRGNRLAVIEEIRRLNSLDDYTVYTGQELKLPN
ncbi:LysM peptidoglycan-binding domain-containing protein [Phytohabitans sp. ZYX-F-186]|uniref:LysM peptidoglycan-binding domain-containing protein n=1 Tax=Phytohabitans maris TaxID=3071409 RepID=A0ABU0ZHM4_9ACTN|nr:LysM peptidoglycan-binding domain-containing protein [Phytohabitans sp. ZYX-F-186]MDQ7906473.1 LysM peptidoglycan-binding domain-containing protein [Phytohabitans sp. ZYX-F-186]